VLVSHSLCLGLIQLGRPAAVDRLLEVVELGHGKFLHGFPQRVLLSLSLLVVWAQVFPTGLFGPEVVLMINSKVSSRVGLSRRQVSCLEMLEILNPRRCLIQVSLLLLFVS
jgi:hypothetical protein